MLDPEATIRRLLTRETTEIAERLMSDAAGWQVTLAVTHSCRSPHTLVRYAVDTAADLPATVIVRRITTSEFTTATDGVSGRLLNERAVLERLTALDVPNVPWPRLLAAGDDVLVTSPRAISDLQSVTALRGGRNLTRI